MTTELASRTGIEPAIEGATARNSEPRIFLSGPVFTYPPGVDIGSSRCSNVGGLVRDIEAPETMKKSGVHQAAGAPSGHVGGDERHHRQHHAARREGDGITRRDAKQECAQRIPHADRQRQANGQSDGGHDHRRAAPSQSSCLVRRRTRGARQSRACGDARTRGRSTCRLTSCCRKFGGGSDRGARSWEASTQDRGMLRTVLRGRLRVRAGPRASCLRVHRRSRPVRSDPGS